MIVSITKAPPLRSVRLVDRTITPVVSKLLPVPLFVMAIVQDAMVTRARAEMVIPELALKNTPRG